MDKLQTLLDEIWYDSILDTYEDAHIAEAVVTQGGDVVRYRLTMSEDGSYYIGCK